MIEGRKEFMKENRPNGNHLVVYQNPEVLDLISETVRLRRQRIQDLEEINELKDQVIQLYQRLNNIPITPLKITR
ncbi:MAG: hypothetical protein J7604_03590 [Sporocytophaga sp.]|uniref:hypothetical protein n=1 Tax=Sporocytophaga sp. TaxID=2231183 RepID=UPI001B256450|nr:hypothetical protein [Sporocytophaga sp.]MBO9699264.1 hypothetical protein [Sporocytophaga sp.]